VGVTVADKAATLGGLVDRSFEDPEVLWRATQRQNRFGGNASAVVPLGDAKQIGMRDVLA